MGVFLHHALGTIPITRMRQDQDDNPMNLFRHIRDEGCARDTRRDTHALSLQAN
jgi:hypothetical protein